MLLEAGIDVLTTMNVQHLESSNDQIWQSTGVRVRETVPDWVVKQADDVVMVDLAPRALLHRLERGVVYPLDRVEAALKNFFVEPTLVALRELAIRHAAHAVESQYATRGGVRRDAGASRPDRLLLLITPDPRSAALIRRGRRVADYLGADCLAVYVSKTPASNISTREERDHLERQLNFARGLQIDTRVLQGADVPEAVVAYARLHQVTQIFVMREPRTRFDRGSRRRSCSGSSTLRATCRSRVVDRYGSARPAGVSEASRVSFITRDVMLGPGGNGGHRVAAAGCGDVNTALQHQSEARHLAADLHVQFTKGDRRVESGRHGKQRRRRTGGRARR